MNTQTNTKHTASNQDTIDNFIIDQLLISPIEEIIYKLKKSYYRDCDIQVLDERLMKFIAIAGETLGLKIRGFVPSKFDKGAKMNEYVRDYFVSRFETLLKYFKTYL